MPFPSRRNRRFFLRIAAVSLCLFAVGTGAAYAWYSAAVNSGNRITVGRVEIAFETAGASEKYFETELTPIEPGEFAPADCAAASARAEELGSARVAESTVTLRSRASSPLTFRLTLEDSAYENTFAVRSSLRFWCYDEAGGAEKSGISFAEFGEISDNLEAGGKAEYRFYVICQSNGFAEGQSLRFDLRAEATAGGETTYPAEIENGDFEDGAVGWTSLLPNYLIENHIKDKVQDMTGINQSGSYFLSSEAYAGFGFRSSTFTLSGQGFLRFKLGGYGAKVKVFLADGTPVAEYGGIAPDMAYLLQTYVADLSPYLGRAMYLEVWFEDAGEYGLADDFSANDPDAANWSEMYDDSPEGLLPWELLENLL